MMRNHLKTKVLALSILRHFISFLQLVFFAEHHPVSVSKYSEMNLLWLVKIAPVLIENLHHDCSLNEAAAQMLGSHLY